MLKWQIFSPAGVLLALSGLANIANATPSLVIDISSGEVLHQEQATQTWYPASLTKLMTTYVALKAVRDGRISMDTPFVVSARAARMAPSKMGFRPGTEVTLDNALKMLMVKSPNDIAVTVAEGTSGSVETFADEMNKEAARLGMQESHFVNPNGLPDNRQVTSARDMAVLGRALYRDFPDQAGLFGIGALDLGGRIIPTHNGLLGRYPGIDGMKTGFTCAAGFNVVASASRNGRRLITVIMGAPSARDRTAKAANLFDKAFFGSANASGNVASLYSQGGTPPDMRGSACHGRSKGGSFASEYEDFSIPLSSSFGKEGAQSERSFMFEAAGQPMGGGGSTHNSGAAIAALGRPHYDAVRVYIGRAPGWTGQSVQASAAPQKVKPGKADSAKGLENASAFAAPKPADIASPLTVDPDALPMHLHAAAPVDTKHKGNQKLASTQPVDAKPKAKAPSGKQVSAKLTKPALAKSVLTKSALTKPKLPVPLPPAKPQAPANE